MAGALRGTSAGGCFAKGGRAPLVSQPSYAQPMVCERLPRRGICGTTYDNVGSLTCEDLVLDWWQWGARVYCEGIRYWRVPGGKRVRRCWIFEFA